MADSLLDLGTTAIWRLKTTNMNWVDGPKFNFDVGRIILGFEGTATNLTALLEDTPQELEFKVTLKSKAEEFAFLTEFYAKKGRHARFWLMSTSNKFTLQNTIGSGSTQIVVKRNECKYQGYERIYLLLSSGDLITRKVTAVSVDENAGTMALSIAASDRTIVADDILLFGLLLLGRLETDAVELIYHTATLAETNLKFRELIGEYGDV